MGAGGQVTDDGVVLDTVSRFAARVRGRSDDVKVALDLQVGTRSDAVFPGRPVNGASNRLKAYRR